jgi:large subunit ribosomal protein L17
MRHGKKLNHLGRTSSHRKALMKNLAISLIIHKRIKTTLAKAKELRKYIEPLVSRSRENTLHNKRTVFAYLRHKSAVLELFRNVAEKVGERPGGYTRVVKLPNRQGDNAAMALIEFVDFNEIYTANKNATTAKKKTRRGRKKGEDTVTTEETVTAPIDAEVAPTPEDTASGAEADELSSEA